MQINVNYCKYKKLVIFMSIYFYYEEYIFKVKITFTTYLKEGKYKLNNYS